MLQKRPSVAFTTFSPLKRACQRRIRDAQKTGLLNLARGIGVQTQRRVRGTQQGDSHVREQNFFSQKKSKSPKKPVLLIDVFVFVSIFPKKNKIKPPPPPRRRSRARYSNCPN